MIDNSLTQTKDSQAGISPAEALELLKAGNERFVAKNTLNRDLNQQVNETAGGQAPFAAVVGCIDSRVPGEMIFDQGIGDIFNVRIAGNFINEDILGSLEFSCAAAGSKLILVLGHSSCGAVKGAIDDVKLGNLTGMLSKIKPAVDAAEESGDRTTANAAFVQKVVDKNIEHAVAAIKSGSSVLNEMYEKGQIDIRGAMYDVASGKVRW